MTLFCYIFKGKDRDFDLQDMHSHIQESKAMIIAFENATPRARQILVSLRSKPLTVALAMLFGLFTNIYQKFDTRKMKLFYGFTT